MQEFIQTIQENSWELITAAGTIFAILFGTRKKKSAEEKKAKKIEKLTEKQKIDTAKMIARQEKIDTLKGENNNAASK